MEPDPTPEFEELDLLVDVVPDDQLRLMFLCCHPALAADSQVALTLRLLGGSRPARSLGGSLFQSRPSPSASSGRSESCVTTTPPTAFLGQPSSLIGSGPCWP